MAVLKVAFTGAFVGTPKKRLSSDIPDVTEYPVTLKEAVLIVNVRVAVPVPPALVALSAMGNVPAVVGVPVINPLALVTAKPPGNPEASKVDGLFVAVI